MIRSCPSCQGENIIRFGHTAIGNPRLRCRDCKKTFCQKPDARAHSDTLKEQVLAALQERCSQRGVCRIFGVSRATVARFASMQRCWLREKIATLPPFETTVLSARKGDSLEADEMWSFVTKKKNKKWVLCKAKLSHG
jgi:transposase-like protein